MLIQRLIALENLHVVPVGEPWRMSDLEPCCRLTRKRTSSLTDDSLPSIADAIATQKVVSFGNLELDVWSRFWHRLRQPRSCELPVVLQLSFVGMVCELSLGLLALLVGAGICLVFWWAPTGS